MCHILTYERTDFQPSDEKLKTPKKVIFFVSAFATSSSGNIQFKSSIIIIEKFKRSKIDYISYAYLKDELTFGMSKKSSMPAKLQKEIEIENYPACI